MVSIAACRKESGGVKVRRLACHAAPSDTAVFDEELQVTLATTARTVPSLAQPGKRLFEPQHGRRQLVHRQRVRILEDGKAIFEPVPRTGRDCIEDAKATDILVLIVLL
jgi:hypothetical protein